MTITQKLTRAADRCFVCASKRRESDPKLATELEEDGTAIRDAIKRLEKKENPAPRTAPTVEEVFTYALEIGLPETETRKFHDYYQSNGWRVGGKTAMKDWRAALRNWMRNWKDRGGSTQGSIAPMKDPAGWTQFLRSKGAAYTSYSTARGYLKDEFAKAKK